jgi:CheY-like chemotaxis protein
MDMQMPLMDGLTATRQIRSVLGLHHLPVFGMTANVLESDRQACLDAGMNGHVPKPFDVNTMVATLSPWLKC